MRFSVVETITPTYPVCLSGAKSQLNKKNMSPASGQNVYSNLTTTCHIHGTSSVLNIFWYNKAVHLRSACTELVEKKKLLYFSVFAKQYMRDKGLFDS